MKSIYRLLLAFLSIVVVSSCAKELDSQSQVVDNSANYHTVTFNLIDDNATKTTLITTKDSTYIAWNSDQDRGDFHIFENGVAASSIKSTFYSGTGKVFLKASFPNSSDTSFTYTGIFGSSITVSADNTLAAILPVQNTYASTFDYDADILLMKPTTTNDTTQSLSLQYGRVVAVNKMTLKGLPADEVVDSIRITSDSTIAGKFSMHSLQYSTDEGDTVIVIKNPNNIAIGEGGTFDVYFISKPVLNATLTVEAHLASGKLYKKVFSKKITLKADSFNSFGVGMTCIGLYESFDCCTGNGGNDGTFTTGSNSLPDKLNLWSIDKGYAASSCIRLGTGSEKGSAQTPKLNITGNATLTFSAAPWSGDATSIKVSLTGGGTISDSVFTMVTDTFTVYTVPLKDVTENTKITFKAIKNSNNRFYLDEVRVTSGLPAGVYTITCNEVSNGTLLSSSQFAQKGDTITLTAVASGSTYFFDDNWSVTYANTQSVAVATNSFKMPASNVTVSGSFTTLCDTLDLSKGSYSETEKNITWSGTSCTITQVKNTGTAVNSGYIASPRWYKNNKITIVPKSSYVLSKVIVTCDTKPHAAVFQSSTYNVGVTSIVSNYEAEIKTNSNSVEITMSEASYVTGIKVYYK